ncbi:olfactory receptor 5AR1-like [Gastrophryne carolinensis]
MGNETLFTELLLSGLSDLPSLQLPLFLFFLLIYLLTLTWNSLIISLIVTDSHLHTPMYFFLGNLASVDICSSSVTIPRMLFDLHTQKRAIGIKTCITQFFFFFIFASVEVFLLAVMSYDRYVAICWPLHYMQIINFKVCLQLVLAVWSAAFSYCSIHSLYALKLKFCTSNIVKGFFCDLPQLFHISCGDVYSNVMLMFLLGGLVGVSSLTLTFVPYVYILKTVIKMQAKGSRSKVFSTCSSHLTTVFIFYGTIMFTYFQPSAKDQDVVDKVLSVCYSVATPLLNPLIYSLRNKEIIAALRDVIIKFAKLNSSKLLFK